MLHENRKDLDGERQKRLLGQMLADLSRAEPDLYYQSTSAIALRLQDHVTKGARLSAEDRSLMQRLAARDIEVLLALH